MEIKQPGSHLDHLLRQTRMSHMQLSTMADAKANMLLTMASIMLTIGAANVSDKTLRGPACCLLTFSLIAIVVAAYAVLPKTGSRSQSADPAATSFNLLFFGDFSKLEYSEYERAMESALNDVSKSYEIQVRDVYVLGCYLAKRKYRYVRISYITFIVGLVTSCVWLLAVTV